MVKWSTAECPLFAGQKFQQLFFYLQSNYLKGFHLQLYSFSLFFQLFLHSFVLFLQHVHRLDYLWLPEDFELYKDTYPSLEGVNSSVSVFVEFGSIVR